MAEIHLVDLLGEDEWRHVQESVTRIAGGSPFILQRDGSLVFPQAHVSEACHMIRGSARGVALCRTSTGDLLSKVRRTKKAVVQVCHAGFVMLAIPVMANGAFLGIVGACMLLGSPIDAIATQEVLARQLSLDERELAKKTQQMPRIDIDTIPRTLERMSTMLENALASHRRRAGAAVNALA